MKPFLYLFSILLVLNLHSSWSQDKEAKHLLQEDFTAPLSAEWFWGLGTWKAETVSYVDLNQASVVMVR